MRKSSYRPSDGSRIIVTYINYNKFALIIHANRHQGMPKYITKFIYPHGQYSDTICGAFKTVAVHHTQFTKDCKIPGNMSEQEMVRKVDQRS